MTPRVALACTGLERVRRGFESFSRDLFSALGGAAALTLFKGGGRPAPGEIVVPNLPRQTSLDLGLTRDWGRAYRWEQLTFALGLAPHLWGEQFGVVHYMDGALAAGLLRLRRALGMRFTLLFNNGGAHTPDTYARVDYIQLVTPMQYREALDYGLPAERLFMVPLGLDCPRFAPPPSVDRAALRAQYGVPPSAWVVLSVAALNAGDKRVDWVIRETAEMGDRDVFLLLAGQRGAETPALERLAGALLPGRHAFVTVAADAVRELCWLADILALGSLREGFALAVVEAASAGLPVVVHDSEHFRWLVGHKGSLADMTREGALAGQLQALRGDAALRGALIDTNRCHVRSLFSWDVLVPQYRAMYAAVGASGGAGG